MSHLLIVGAAGGIGSALVARLRAAGPVRLTLVGRRHAPLVALAQPGDAVLVADVADPACVDRLWEHLQPEEPLTGAVNLAGSLLLKPAHRTTAADWRSVMAANLDSAFHVLQAVVRSRAAGGPQTSLVFVSSVAATLGLMNHEAIAAAKAGVEGLTRSAAATYGVQGLRVNAVAPSLTETPLTAALVAAPANRQAVTDRHVLGRLGSAEDVAAAITFLLSPDSSWITGQVLGVDGGLGAVRPR